MRTTMIRTGTLGATLLAISWSTACGGATGLLDTDPLGTAATSPTLGSGASPGQGGSAVSGTGGASTAGSAPSAIGGSPSSGGAPSNGGASTGTAGTTAAAGTSASAGMGASAGFGTGTVGVGGGTAGTSGVTGMGGGGPSASCVDCINAQCGDQVMACDAAPTCAMELSCVTDKCLASNPPQMGCVQMCLMGGGKGGGMFFQVAGCINAACGMSCPHVGGKGGKGGLRSERPLHAHGLVA